MNGSFSVDGAFRQRTMGRPASAGARQATLVLLQWTDQRPPICYSVYKKGRVSKRSCHAKRDDARTAAAVGREVSNRHSGAVLFAYLNETQASIRRMTAVPSFSAMRYVVLKLRAPAARQFRTKRTLRNRCYGLIRTLPIVDTTVDPV
jgi:hypothetical protein